MNYKIGVGTFCEVRRIIVVLMLFTAFTEVSSQEVASRIKQIDSLVMGMNAAGYPVHRDTLVQDHPELGLKMITYLSTIVKDGQLFKYVNFVRTVRTENGVTKEIETSTSFYYHHNELIKVEEEFMTDSVKQKLGDWYFWDDKSIYYTSKSEKAAQRSTLLLSMSKGIKERMVK